MAFHNCVVVVVVIRLSARHVSLPTGVLVFVAIRVESLLPQEEPDGTVDDVLASIEILCSRVVRGQQCCDSILTSYRISKVRTNAPNIAEDQKLAVLQTFPSCRIVGSFQVIGKSFKRVVEQDEYSVLRQLLGSEHLNKFVLAKSFVTTFALADNEVPHTFFRNY